MSHELGEAAERLKFEGHLSEVLLGILANAGKPGTGTTGAQGCHRNRGLKILWTIRERCLTRTQMLRIFIQVS